MSVQFKKPENEELKNVQDLDDVDDLQDEEDEETGNEDIDFKKLYQQEKEKADQLTNRILDLSKKDHKNKDEDPNVEHQPKPSNVVKFLEEGKLDDDTFQDVVSDKRTFVEMLNEFGNSVRLKTFEEVMNVIPGAVSNIASFHINLNEMNRQFFENNPELAPMRKFVSGVADEIIRTEKVNTLSEYEKVLERLPKTVKDRMKEMGLEPPKKGQRQQTSSGQAAPRDGQRRQKRQEPLDDFQRSLEYSKKRRNRV